MLEARQTNELNSGYVRAVVRFLDLLRCPISGNPLRVDGDQLKTEDGNYRYRVSEAGIPLFASAGHSEDARYQEAHYDKIGDNYAANLTYPHTQGYMRYLDDCLVRVVRPNKLGTVTEICCGTGEAFKLVGKNIDRGIGVDISMNMLEKASAIGPGNVCFVQGDATKLPLASGAFDAVFMLGGIHHVNDRRSLFGEVARILKPGGLFYFREPVNDFVVWRAIRAVIYRIAPALDHKTERPLLNRETVPVLEQAGLIPLHWSTHGFFGFCLFMNSDVLIFNRLFRFIPRIGGVASWFARLDESFLRLPGLGRWGLQVVGVAGKPAGGPRRLVDDAAP
jgi:ubiquinone/menaquinone biosynthesis C-methylase UbiE